VPTAVNDEAVGQSSIEFVSTGDLDDLRRGHKPERLFERLFTDGSPMLTVDHLAGVGYRIWAPYHGRHVVSEDGRRIHSAPPRRAGWWWQRLLLAQVLPIAATLQGLELLHASAVAFGERTIAITAEAGSGKTSLAAHLLDLDGELVADDVLALQLVDDRVVAHPGVGLVNIDPVQRATLGPRAAALLAESVGEGDKLYVLARLVDRPLPLSAVYFLHRDESFKTLRIVTAEEAARRLLGSGFISYLASAERLLGHFEVYSRIAETIPPFVIQSPLQMSPKELAARVREHGEGAW
jgi:hypothetical protein